MSKVFNGSTSRIHWTSVAENMNDALCMFAVLRIDDTSDTSWQSFFQWDADLTDAAVTRLSMGRRVTGNIYFATGSGIDDAIAIGDGDGWMKLWVIRDTAAATEYGKALDGVTTPTTAAGGALADGLSVSGYALKFGGDDDPFNGKLACLAWWDGSPPTSAQLAACESTDDLLALSPDHCYDDSDGFASDLVGSFDPSALLNLTDSADDPTDWAYFGSGGGGTPPANTVAPAVTGNPWRTQTLTTTDGTWTGDPTITYAYQWQRDNSGGGSYSNIGGATASTRVLDANDVGCQVRCVVTATNDADSVAANSNAVLVGDLYTAPVAGTGKVEVRGSAVVTYDGPAAPENTVAPTLFGDPWRDQILTTASDGTWTGDPTIEFTYQWQRDDSGGGTFGNISGATSGFYILDAADVDCQVRVVVTGTNGVGNSSANSNAFKIGDLYTAPVAGSGRVEVCGNAVVTYDPAGAAETPPSNTVAPVASGNPWRTQTLTTTDGTWDGEPAPGFTYQWQRDNSGGGSYSNIGGATASTRVLDANDVGCQVRCVVTGTNSEGSDTANSNALLVGDLYTGPPAGSGKVEVRGSAEVNYDIPLAPGAGNGSSNLSSGSMTGMRF